MVDEWKRKYEPLVERWKDGTLVQASKEELEKFLVLVCLNGFRNNRIEHADPREIAETVRLLLHVRAAEEMQAASNTTNKIVVVLTIVIVVLTAFQAYIAACPQMGWCSATTSQPQAASAEKSQPEAPKLPPPIREK